jgi:hypothetical protein
MPRGGGHFFGFLRECPDETEMSFMLREEKGMTFVAGAMRSGSYCELRREVVEASGRR